MSNLTQLEAEAEAKRLRLERTLGRLEQRASFESLVDEVIARSGAPTPNEVADVLRRNPALAAGLALCVGLIAWEVVKARKRRVARQARHGLTSARDRLSAMS